MSSRPLSPLYRTRGASSRPRVPRASFSPRSLGVGETVTVSPDIDNGIGYRVWPGVRVLDGRRVHVGVQRRGTGFPIPLVITVPPTGIEPATFGTGNQRLLRTDNGNIPNFRMIPGLRAEASGHARAVNGYTCRSMPLLSERVGSILICMDNDSHIEVGRTDLSSEREDLAALIARAVSGGGMEESPATFDLTAADAILAAGYRRPCHHDPLIPQALAIAAELEGFAEGSNSARASLMRDAARTIRALAGRRPVIESQVRWGTDSDEYVFPPDPSSPRRRISIWMPGEGING